MNVTTPGLAEYQVEFLTPSASFDPLSLSAEAAFTQSDFYFCWQRAAGKEAKRFFIKDGSEIVAYAQCFFTPLRFLGGRGYWYAPYGPVCSPKADRARVAAAIAKTFSHLNTFSTSVFFRLDFSPAIESPKDASSVQLPSPCSAFLVDGSIQPRSDWVLSLVPSEAELIATMHQKARYSIQYAQRKGAVVKVVSEKYEEYLKDFCRLMQETARRDGFVPHPDSYYQALFSELRQDQGFLVVGSHSGECVAIALVLVYGKTATYVFGASSNTHRNISVPALVQWQAIVEAKRRGCAEYSFGGASSSRFPVKSWAGITAFKQRFGGYAQDHSPVIDLVFQSSWYRVFVARKWLRHYFHI